MNNTNPLIASLEDLIWAGDLAAIPWWKSIPLKGIRILYVIVRDLVQGQLSLRAMSLVFTTLLSLVPVIAVSFSVLKAFGAHNQVEPLLFGFLEPLGDKGVEVTTQIIGFVDNIKVGVLGAVGIAMLIYTAVSLIQKVEDTFNYTWHVQRSRSFATRFSSYLSVIIIGPVLVFSSMGVTATLMNTSFVQAVVAIEPFGSLYRAISLMIPYLLIIVAFTFTYVFIPNTSVRMSAALPAGVVAGVSWNIIGKFFAAFMVASTQYTAIYSGFAIVLLFMIWVYISWLIMLIGASIAFYLQHPEYLLRDGRDFLLSNRMKESLSLWLFMLIGQRYYHDLPAWSVESLSKRLGAPSGTVADLLEIYVQNRLLSRTDAEPPGYLPARPLDKTTIKQVLDAVRCADEDAAFRGRMRSLPTEIDNVISGLEEATAVALEGRTVRDLVEAESFAEQPGSDSVVIAVAGQGDNSKS